MLTVREVQNAVQTWGDDGKWDELSAYLGNLLRVVLEEKSGDDLLRSLSVGGRSFGEVEADIRLGVDGSGRS